jgi:CubicO group peptidase (beta-lactamase class C family)
MGGSPGASARSLAAILPASIGPFVENLLATDRIPGFALAVTYDGNVVLDQGYGVVGNAARTPVTTGTPFQIGSLTKTFTAIAILMIAEDPSLIDTTANPGVRSFTIDAPMRTYLPIGVPLSLPSLPGGQSFTLPAAWAGVTARQLLNMSSGLPDDLNYSPWNKVIENLIRHRNTRPVFKPAGSRYLYSDAGFQVLGALIEKLTDQSYSQFVQQHILTPLGMTGTTVLTGSQTQVAGQAIGFATYNPHTNAGKLPSGGYYSGASAYGAAAIVSSAQDLGTYMAALWNESSQLLSASSYAEMWTPVPLATNVKPRTLVTPGLGWDDVDPNPAGTTILKTGSVPGYQAEIALFEGDGVGVAIAFNLNNPVPHRGSVSAPQLVGEIHAAVDSVLAEAL